MSFTEFCCRSGGSNLNSGTRTGSSTVPGTAADFTYASGTWVQSTRVFTVASGNPLTDGVAVGDFVSVYADGATTTGYVARVTAVDATTITTHATAKAGTAPTDGTGTRTLKVGGAWKGPNATDGFPMTILAAALANTSSAPPRCNLMNDANYNVSAQITSFASATTVVYQGFNATYGDLGKATIDGQTSAIIVLVAQAACHWVDLIFTSSATTGSNHVVQPYGTGCTFTRCVAKGGRGAGFKSTIGYTGQVYLECESYGNVGYGFDMSAGNGSFINCISHDNSGGGWYLHPSGPWIFVNCIADSNTGHGWYSGVGNVHINCDAYNNTSSGFYTVYGNCQYINCNMIKNGAYGFTNSNTHTQVNYFFNCGLGAGTQANGSGGINTFGQQPSIIVGTVTYASDVTPWVDPANGDFRISLVAAKGAGRGAYTQTAASYAGTVGYPDIGAAQHVDGGGGGVRQINIRGGADQ